MNISHLFNQVGLYFDNKNNDFVSGIEFDSRKIKENNLFIALKGYTTDGHKFIKQAFDNGASYALIDEDKKNELVNTLDSNYHQRLFPVKNTRDIMPYIAKAFYDYPDRKMKIIGVTGTKGKTTITYIIKSILEASKKKVGLIGTINYLIGKDKIKSDNTTPESLNIYRLLSKMYDERVDYVVMEISSHALSLKRVEGLDIDVALFSNFSQDHMDFHKTMEEYFQAKLLIFDLLKKSSKKDKIAIINGDIKEYSRIREYLNLLNVNHISYGLNKNNTIYSDKHNIDTIEESSMDVIYNNTIHIKSNLIGDYNIYNILCSLATMYHYNINQDFMKEGVRNVYVPGRLEKININNNSIAVIDYAHTDKSLENVLITLNKLKQNRIITVFGCGGDRDKLKRPLMGDVAYKYSDIIIITSDNPRTEDPMAIITDINRGINNINKKPIYIEENRREAIHFGLSMLEKDDILLIAGKGHEDYQILKDKTIHFSDKEEVLNYINNNK